MRMRGAILAALLVALTGCAKDRPVPVSGIVRLEGRAIPGAVVTFHPERSGRMATGTCDGDGHFALTTLQSGDGAFPGDYKVTVQYAEGVTPPPSTNVRDAFAGMAKAKPAKVAPKFVVPERYSRPNQTELRHTVPGATDLVLELKGK